MTATTMRLTGGLSQFTKTITVLNKRIHDECDHDVPHYWLQSRKDTGLCTCVLQLMMSMEHVNKVIFPIEVLQPA